MKIEMFKLVSGEYIIADVVEENDEYLTLSEVVVPRLVPAGENQVSVMLSPYVVFDQSQSKLELAKIHVMFKVANPDPDLVAKYNEMVTGIIAAGSIPANVTPV